MPRFRTKAEKYVEVCVVNDGDDVNIKINGVLIAYFCADKGTLILIELNDEMKHKLTLEGIKFYEDRIATE